MRHKDKHKTVFLLLGFRLEKIKTNRAYLHKPRYAKHGLGYRDLYYEWNPTRKHRLKSHNLMSLLEVT